MDASANHAVIAGCPARAGIDPIYSQRGFQRIWLPRAGGDRPDPSLLCEVCSRVAPRGRG